MQTKQAAIDVAKDVLQKAGVRVQRANLPPGEQTIRFAQAILDYYRVAAGPDFFFVQVGGCDGVSFDDLYQYVTKHHLKGIVLEPLPDLYAELCANYAEFPMVKPVNVALHRTEKTATLYRVAANAAGVPDWAKGIASLDPDHHRRTGIPAESVVRETVPCVTFEELVSQHKIERIDYLQIDTEGYDYEILQMIDLEKIRPSVIRFEHQIRAGVMSAAQLSDLLARFAESGYLTITTAFDAFAYLPGQ